MTVINKAGALPELLIHPFRLGARVHAIGRAAFAFRALPREAFMQIKGCHLGGSPLRAKRSQGLMTAANPVTGLAVANPGMTEEVIGASKRRVT